MTELVLGPMLRYVDDTSATIWVEVDGAATVAVTAGEQRFSARTFGVHGHHYALVEVDGLAPASRTEYAVEIDGAGVWPPTDSPYPASVIPTLEPGKPLRIAFGSCRTSVSHDEAGNKSHGVDALRAYALRMADEVPPGDDSANLADPRWPDLVLFLGDQVYADETTEEMREFICSRRDIEQPPWAELKDYAEYAHLYRLAWTDPANRWLLSTLPSAMIFDDHDIRDDWNTSLSWKREMEATSWWHGRIVAGLASYWVHQHLGNLGPEERRHDEIWQRVASHQGDDEVDLSEVLDAFADRVDQEPHTYRWSFAREFDTQARLVVVDSRAARVLDPGRRALLDPVETRWLEQQMRGDVDHLLIGTSLPFMLARGLHFLEAFGEGVAEGAWGKYVAPRAETVRQLVDLEHWAAFQRSFLHVAQLCVAVATGQRGRPPGTLTFLSGDVHHSYVSEAEPSRRARRKGEARPWSSRVLQAVCSPIRNPLDARMRFATAALSYGVAGPLGRLTSLSAKVSAGPITWKYTKGPWFDNNIGCLELEGRDLRMWWMSGVVTDDHARPRLEQVAEYRSG